ncbi:MAG: DUF4349 domain-containing protein [Oscillospiraceae bacterium]|nr:DUF4349 domain-containing protein [Oscillospiraceae bacterium]
MKRRSFAILLTLLMLLGLCACGGSDGAKNSSGATAPAAVEEEYGYWSEEPAEVPMEAAMEADMKTAGSGDTRASLPDGVKMIYRANLELESTEYDKAREDIAALTQQLGGYFEEQNSNNRGNGYYRSASYTVRVPAAQFENFLSQIGTLCNVRWQSQSAEDVSEYYYDTASRLETAKIKLDRLQELLAKAETMEDIITVESAISEVEYQIESLSGELRHYDALIDYSTIYVTLTEVYKITETELAPLTFSQRIAKAFRNGLRDFGDGLEDFAEWLAYSWLTVLVLVVIVVVVVKLIRRKARGPLLRRKKKAEPPQQTDGEAQ